MNVKGTKKKNQVVKVNIFEQQEIITKAEAIMRNLKVQDDFKPSIVKSKGSIQQYPDWDEEDFDNE